MSFTLQVDFSGLCLYVHDASTERVAVLMPDGRRLPPKDAHPDGTFGVPHAGYFRFSLANFPALPDGATPLPQGDDNRPPYEVVHLFNRQVLGFEVTGAADPITFAPMVPLLEAFAPNPGTGGGPLLEVDNTLFDAAPPATLLARTILEGGAVTGENVKENWFFPSILNPGMQAYQTTFANVVRWTRTVDSVAVTVRGFEPSSPVTRIPLAPAAGSSLVRIKVANLCATNPLEWDELGIRAADHDDVDFKWLYRLLKPRSGTWADVLKGNRLPIPHLPADHAEGVEDCLGMQTTGSVPG